MFYYFLYVACGIFLVCLAYAIYVIWGRLAALRGLRQLAFRVQMLAHGRTLRLGSCSTPTRSRCFSPTGSPSSSSASSFTWSAAAAFQPPTARGNVCHLHSTGSNC